MATTITDVVAHDIRFPTSRTLAGSDAMNPEPDYSAAYVVLDTDDPRGLQGHGFTFTIGRGHELCVEAIRSLAPLVRGQQVETFIADPAEFWSMLTAREFVRCIPFRYITDVITPDEALDDAKRSEREAYLREHGYPAYTTSAGWLGYTDEQLRQLCREGLAEGWTHFKLKVGRDLEDDVRRARIIREEIGPDRKLMMDANQVWDVDQAIAWMGERARFDPWWIEEPTSPDDVLGRAQIAQAIAPIRVATGEHCQIASCSSSCFRPTPSASARSMRHDSAESARCWRCW